MGGSMALYWKKKGFSYGTMGYWGSAHPGNFSGYGLGGRAIVSYSFMIYLLKWCVCIYIYICIRICICLYVNVYVNVYVYVY